MAKEFTVMLLSEKSGRNYSTKMSRISLLMIVVFLIALITITTVLLNSYLHVRRQNKSFEFQINELQTNLDKLNDESRDAELYKQWADRIIFRRLNYEDLPGQGNVDLNENARDGEITAESYKSSRSLLDVDEFDVRRVNLELDFEMSFKLLNRTPDRKNLAGYIFAIASNRDVKPEIYDSWPRVENMSGLPKDFKKGSKFSIRYLKNIKGRINQPDIGPKFNRVDLIAYAEDGKIIMKKAYYVERFLQQSPY